MQQKVEKKTSSFLDLTWLQKILIIRKRILVICSQCFIKNSPKILFIFKRDILQLNFLQIDEKCDKKAIAKISAVFDTL